MTKARSNSYGTVTLGSTILTLGSTTTSVSGLGLPSSILTSPSEFTNIVAAAPTATNNIDILTSQDWLFTTNTANSFAPNIRGDGSNTLNTIMSIGHTKAVSIRVTNGTTAWYITAITIDGVAQTVKWQGSAPTSGNASASDIYSFAITKTAASTYTVLGIQTKFV